MEHSDLDFDELIYVDQSDNIIKTMTTRILALKREKTKKKLLLITGSTSLHAKLYHKLCVDTYYRQVHLIVGKDYPNPTSIQAGRLLTELTTGPERCNSKFTGYLEEKSMTLANGLTVMNTKPFETVFMDFQRNPSAIHGRAPQHYIYIGANSATATYGCGRSYVYSEENMRMFLRFKDTNVYYNLVIPHNKHEDLEFDSPTMVVSSYYIKGVRKFFQSKCTSIRSFITSFKQAQSMDLEFDVESYESGWNLLNSEHFSSNSFMVIKNSLIINYDYELVNRMSTYPRKEIYWADSEKGLPSCGLFSCFYITFKNTNDKTKEISLDIEKIVAKIAEAMIPIMAKNFDDLDKHRDNLLSKKSPEIQRTTSIEDKITP